MDTIKAPGYRASSSGLACLCVKSEVNPYFSPNHPVWFVLQQLFSCLPLSLRLTLWRDSCIICSPGWGAHANLNPIRLLIYSVPVMCFGPTKIPHRVGLFTVPADSSQPPSFLISSHTGCDNIMVPHYSCLQRMWIWVQMQWTLTVPFLVSTSQYMGLKDQMILLFCILWSESSVYKWGKNS